MAVVPFRAQLDILSDTSSDDDHLSQDSVDLSDSALRHLIISNVQNIQYSATSNSAIESLITGIEKLQIDPEAREFSQVNEEQNWDSNSRQQYRRRLSRPAIAPNTFELLETVPENEPQRTPSRTTSASPKELQHPKLPASGEKFSDHPLVELARKGIPSTEEQLAQHCDGWYQGILSTKIPIGPQTSAPNANPTLKEIHFGWNLLPTQNNTENKDPNETGAPSFDILLAPLATGEESKIEDSEVLSKGSMALAKPTCDLLTPVKESEASSSDETQQSTLIATSPTNSRGKCVEDVSSRPPLKTIARIEDSVEALDKLEEQLEAFDEAAHFRQIVSPGAPDAGTRSTMQSLSVANTRSMRSATPQPKRTTPVKPGSGSVMIKSTSEPRRSVRKSASMIFLDSPKLKSEDKPLLQAPQRRPSIKGIASLLPPKQPPKSAKKPTIPTFELPGDEVARKLKEKREARALTSATAEQATKPTISSLRRAKSAKAPTRPNFELPGEAISRRKREEREAQLKAQEEEERKRREFKARPIRSSIAPSTFPRDTVASRARQSKIQPGENSTHHSGHTPTKHPPMINSRSPLSKTNNQTIPRGRNLHPEPLGLQPSRGTSSSSTMGSISGQRSSVSTEEVQQQKIRGQEIFKRDNSWSGEREREKRERETLAKLAREEAAERSRQKSREWAAKQAKKRMTITSVRDLLG